MIISFELDINNNVINIREIDYIIRSGCVNGVYYGYELDDESNLINSYTVDLNNYDQSDDIVNNAIKPYIIKNKILKINGY